MPSSLRAILAQTDCVSASGPFITELHLREGEEKSTFVFVQGEHPIQVPEQFDGFFGPPPNCSFLLPDAETSALAVRTFPRDMSPEDAIRSIQDTSAWPKGVMHGIMDRLIKLIDEDTAIDGVIGYSEGCSIASSLIVAETHRQKTMGRDPRIKCAMFINGIPPTCPVTDRPVLMDEIDGPAITIPSCHILGTQDPLAGGAMALYNVCDPDTADLFDHGGGHTFPRGRDVQSEIAETVCAMIESLDD